MSPQEKSGKTSSRRLDLQQNICTLQHRQCLLAQNVTSSKLLITMILYIPLHIPFTCLGFPEMLLLIWIIPFLQGYICLSVHIIITYVKAILRMKVNHINCYTRNLGINYNSSIQITACDHSILWKLPQLLPLLALSLYHHLEQVCSIHCLIFLHYLFMWILPHFPFQNEWKLWNQRPSFPRQSHTEETHSDYWLKYF